MSPLLSLSVCNKEMRCRIKFKARMIAVCFSGDFPSQEIDIDNIVLLSFDILNFQGLCLWLITVQRLRRLLDQDSKQVDVLSMNSRTKILSPYQCTYRIVLQVDKKPKRRFYIFGIKFLQIDPITYKSFECTNIKYIYE